MSADPQLPHRPQFQITFDCADPLALSCFWRDALGYVHPWPPGVDPTPEGDPLAAWDEFMEANGVPQERRDSASAVEDPGGVRPRLFFQRVPEGKQGKNRLHLDVQAAPGLTGTARMDALEAEADRLVALGASRLQRHEPAPPMDAGFLVMADPEGNEFCLD